MKQKNDGGPAFPVGVAGTNDGGVSLSSEHGEGGMTLRDWFAGQAIAGISAYPSVLANLATMSDMAYQLADAMLAARDKG